jgi:hypothetical protein
MVRNVTLLFNGKWMHLYLVGANTYSLVQYSLHSQLSLCYAWGNRSRLYMCQQSSLLQRSFVLHWLPLFPWRYDPSQFLL